MEKLALHTSDLTAQNVENLARLFPNCVTESRDAQGMLVRAIDFDQLRQELSGSIVEGPQERYELNWPGKREAMLAANAPIAKTLRPCREESVDFDTTRNLFIEGDNLDALKLLQESYLGEIKLIYIDPPYNTGNDFIYEDDFAENSEAYLLRSNQEDEQGNRLVANTEGNGRFHSDWLSMILPRLRLARNLLRDDGAIMISTDDNEVATLRLVCDEVFGPTNFVSQIVWQKAKQGDGKLIGRVHEYIVCYAKSKNSLVESGGWRRKKEGVDEVLGYYRQLRLVHGTDHTAIREAMQTWYKGLNDKDPQKLTDTTAGLMTGGSTLHRILQARMMDERADRDMTSSTLSPGNRARSLQRVGDGTKRRLSGRWLRRLQEFTSARMKPQFRIVRATWKRLALNRSPLSFTETHVQQPSK